MTLQSIPIPPSTNLAAVDYNDETLDLIITFVRGSAKYIYKQVPANVAAGFQTSGMRANAYFNKAVLNQFVTQRVG